MIFCLLLTLSKLFVFCLKKLFWEHYQSVKQFESRSGPTKGRSWSGSRLFAKVISRWQKSPLAHKGIRGHLISHYFHCMPCDLSESSCIGVKNFYIVHIYLYFLNLWSYEIIFAVIYYCCIVHVELDCRKTRSEIKLVVLCTGHYN